MTWISRGAPDTSPSRNMTTLMVRSASSRVSNHKAPMRPSAPETLDLRNAAVAVGQFDRDRFGLRRELQIRRRVMRNHAGVPGIARRHFQHLVGHRAVDADAHFADRA